MRLTLIFLLTLCSCSGQHIAEMKARQAAQQEAAEMANLSPERRKAREEARMITSHWERAPLPVPQYIYVVPSN